MPNKAQFEFGLQCAGNFIVSNILVPHTWQIKSRKDDRN